MRLSQLECLARSKLSEQKLRDRSLSLGLRRISWGRAWLLAVCCVALVLNLGATGVLAARAPAVLTACSFKALTSAVPRGGLVVFGCDGTIGFTSPINLSKGQSVTLDGSGHAVAFDGMSKTQLFDLAGGCRVQSQDLASEQG